jgi:apolipoprotein N-acyltransferase
MAEHDHTQVGDTPGKERDMATMLTERPQKTSAPAAPSPVDRPVSEIIEAARTAPAPIAGGLGASLAAGALMWASFFPLDWGPLAWLAPIPLLMLARIRQRTRWMYRSVYLGGAAFWVTSLQWMRLGDVAMIPAWLALALYMAIYFPVFLAVTRLAVHRLNVPLVAAAPIAWAGLEYLRSTLMSGFAWYQLGHSQHEWTTLIQICDLTGVYGVSFLIMLAAAAVVECLPAQWFARTKLLPPVSDSTEGVLTASSRRRTIGVLASIGLVGASLIYGGLRRARTEFELGPRVALIQGDFRSELKRDPQAARRILEMHRSLTASTIPFKPDVVVWPETMYPSPIFDRGDDMTPEDLKRAFPDVDPTWWEPRFDVRPSLRDRAEEAGAAMIVGIVSYEASKDRTGRFNSAAFVEPQRGVTGRYDKIHLVPFGEYIPLKDKLPFLSGMSTYGSGVGLSAGEDVHVFNLGQWRLLPLICFEDTVPHLVREMTRTAAGEAGSPVDCLVNLTNDGWFRDSSEQDQHLITAAFRCIETRTPMVRAVNTGISAVIDGDGIVRDPVAFIDYDRTIDPQPGDAGPIRTGMRDPRTGRFYKSLNAALVADVPLDPRGSWYLWWGDVFAGGCLVLTLASIGYGRFVRTSSPVAA